MDDTEVVVYTREDFWNLSPKEIENLTGVVRPVDQTSELLEEYREEAWRSYQLDVKNAQEWGNARQEVPVDPEELEE